MAAVGDWEAGVNKATWEWYNTDIITRKEKCIVAVSTLKGRTARVVVSSGVDSQGNSLTANVSVSGLSSTASAWDADKFLNIVGALEACLKDPVVSAETVETLTVAPNN